MNIAGLVSIVAYIVILLLLAKPFGAYMAQVFDGQPPLLGKVLGPVERFIYRVCGIDPSVQQRWTSYAAAMLLFNFIGFLAVYALQRVQAFLPLNPQDFSPVSADSSFNTA